MPLKINPVSGILDLVISPGGGTASTSFATDVGSAVPTAGGIITMAGGTGLNTAGAGNTVTFNLDSPVLVTTGGTGLTSLTDGAVLVGNGTSATELVGPLTDGQLLIGDTAGVSPVAATLTAGAGMTIVNAAGSITLSAGASVATTYTCDSGSATPAANILTVVGGGSTTTTGAGSTVTVELTGLTNHAVLIGAGTNTITKVGPVASTGAVLVSNGAGSDPGFTTATYPLTTTVNQILYSSATNTVAGLATANSAVITTTAAGVPVATALATDGQLIIGSTAGAPAAATLTAGAGISIVNAGNSITITNTGAGVPWTVVTGATQALAVANGYIGNRGTAITYTLPATAAVGDIIEILNIGAGLPVIAQNAGDYINFTSSTTTPGVGGSLTAVDQFASITLICVVANDGWNVLSSTGSWTVV